MYKRVPGPVPVAPETIVIQLGPVTVEYEHPAGVFTVTDPEPPFGGHEASGAPRITVQLAALCVALNVCPAIVALSMSEELLLFGGMVNVTEPLPVPEVGAAPNPDAVQEQEEFEVETVTDAIPPAGEICNVAGLIPNEQPVFANCVMVNNCPLTAIVPVR